MSLNVSQVANSLGYIGVEAPTPPNMNVYPREPNSGDYVGYKLGDLWLYWLHPNPQTIWMLVDLTYQSATWSLMGSTAGDILFLTADDGNKAFPFLGNINLAGDGVNIRTTSTIPNTITVELAQEFTDTFITNSGAAQPDVNGEINIFGGTNMSTVATGPNTITINMNPSLILAGSLTTGTTLNVGTDLVVGGTATISSLGLGVVQSSALGVLSSTNGTQGQILIGQTGLLPVWNTLTAGTNLTIDNSVQGAITINATSAGGAINFVTNNGTATEVAGSLNVFTQGGGTGFLATYGAGATVTVGIPGGITDGMIPISSSATNQPLWRTITAGVGITVTNGNNSIILSAAGGGAGGLVQITTDAGAAAEDGANNINLFGTALQITTTATGANTITISIPTNPTLPGNVLTGGSLTTTTSLVAGSGFTVSSGAVTVTPFGKGILHSTAAGVVTPIAGEADTKIIIGVTASAPVWGNLTSTGATVAITYPDATHINLEATGTAGLTQLTPSTGIVATALAGNINVFGTTNQIVTTGTANTITASLSSTLSLPGTLTIPSLSQGVLQASATGVISASKGTDGQVLISSTGAINPTWGNITPGTGISIVNAGGSITITNTASSGGVNTFNTQSGTATGSGGAITINGGENINTAGATNTVVVNLNRSVSLPATTADSLNGVYAIGTSAIHDTITDRFLHSYGTRNCFVGHTSGNFTLTTGSAINNTGVGDVALTSLTTGSANSTLGRRAGQNITTGTDNTLIGNDSGRLITTALSNSCFGSESGTLLTTGAQNTLLGASAGNSMNTGTRNTVVGHLAANTITSATDNVAVGDLALSTSTTSLNVAVGSKSLRVATSGVNTAVGYNTLGACTTGTSNVAVGLGSLQTITTGGNNTAVGSTSLGILAGSGSDNVAVGGGALLTTGSSNIYIGSPGAAVESTTIRIGETSGTTQTQTATYISGIYNHTVATTQGFVIVDNLSKVGSLIGGTNGQIPSVKADGSIGFKTLTSTDNSIEITNNATTINLATYAAKVAFNYFLTTTVANVTGDNSTYIFGSSSAFTKSFDIGSNVAVGGLGNPVLFTAPYTGVYQFTVNCLITNLVAPPAAAPNPVCPLEIRVSSSLADANKIYALIGSYYYPQTSDPNYSRVMNYFYTALVPMHATDTAQFSISISYGTGTKTLGLGGIVSFGGSPALTLQGTSVQGHLVARAASF